LFGGEETSGGSERVTDLGRGPIEVLSLMGAVRGAKGKVG